MSKWSTAYELLCNIDSFMFQNCELSDSISPELAADMLYMIENLGEKYGQMLWDEKYKDHKF